MSLQVDVFSRSIKIREKNAHIRKKCAHGVGVEVVNDWLQLSLGVV